MLALGALALGPLIYAVSRRFRWTLSVVDGFVLSAVGALVVLHVAPRALSAGGIWAGAALILGLAAPAALHEVFSERKTDRWVVVIGLFALMVHSATDGAALASGDHALSWAIVLHRLPAGLFVWWLVRPSSSAGRAWLVLALVAASTAAGFLIGLPESLHQGAPFAVFEALVAGALLHVLIGHGPELHGPEHHAHAHGAELAGATAGILLVLLVPEGSGHHVHALKGYGGRLLHISLATAPVLLGGYAAAGILATWLPRPSLGWIGRGSRVGQAMRGLLFGAPLPVSACDVVPVYKRVFSEASTATAGAAFMVITPLLGVTTILLSLPLLGLPMTLLRVGASLIIAFLAALVVGGFVRRQEPAEAPGEEENEPAPFGARLKAMIAFGFREVVDHTLGWILLGLAVAALFDAGVFRTWLELMPSGTQVVLFASISMPLYVSAPGATPLAAAFVAAGASPGSALAFLLAGPATNLAIFTMLRRLHGPKVVVLFGGLIFALTVAAGLVVDALDVRMPQRVDSAEIGAVHYASLVGIGGLLVASLIRQGPRRFVLSIFRPHHHHEHHH